METDPNAYDPDILHTITFRDGEPAPLRPLTGPSGLRLDVHHLYRIVRDEDAAPRARWRVTTRAYEYRLLDYNEEELVVYHWQPGPEFRGPDHPHMHVSASLTAQVSSGREEAIPLDKMHLATGRVSLEAIVRTLVDDFGVKPIPKHWRQQLARTEAELRRLRRQADW